MLTFAGIGVVSTLVAVGSVAGVVVISRCQWRRARELRNLRSAASSREIPLWNEPSYASRTRSLYDPSSDYEQIDFVVPRSGGQIGRVEDGIFYFGGTASTRC